VPVGAWCCQRFALPQCFLVWNDFVRPNCDVLVVQWDRREETLETIPTRRRSITRRWSRRQISPRYSTTTNTSASTSQCTYACCVANTRWRSTFLLHVLAPFVFSLQQSFGVTLIHANLSRLGSSRWGLCFWSNVFMAMLHRFFGSL